MKPKGKKINWAELEKPDKYHRGKNKNKQAGKHWKKRPQKRIF